MGIRFMCPNGHKLNVKADLAGKRASCPECGAKLVVPGAPSKPVMAPIATVVGAAVPAGSVWFLQTPDGQQFGPATDAQFSEWIAAGRVGADSHVWRDGWPEWKVAREAADLLPKPLAAVPVAKAPVSAPIAAPAAAPQVAAPQVAAPQVAAPQVAAAPAAPSAPAPPPELVIASSPEPIAAAAASAEVAEAIVDDSAAPSANVYALRKQRNKKTQVTLAVVMLVTVIVLAGVLIWVIVNGSAETPAASQLRAIPQQGERT